MREMNPSLGPDRYDFVTPGSGSTTGKGDLPPWMGIPPLGLPPRTSTFREQLDYALKVLGLDPIQRRRQVQEAIEVIAGYVRRGLNLHVLTKRTAALEALFRAYAIEPCGTSGTDCEFMLNVRDWRDHILSVLEGDQADLQSMAPGDSPVFSTKGMKHGVDGGDGTCEFEKLGDNTGFCKNVSCLGSTRFNGTTRQEEYGAGCISKSVNKRYWCTCDWKPFPDQRRPRVPFPVPDSAGDPEPAPWRHRFPRFPPLPPISPVGVVVAVVIVVAAIIAVAILAGWFTAAVIAFG